VVLPFAFVVGCRLLSVRTLRLVGRACGGIARGALRLAERRS
jgi:hypothetical protein